MAWGDGGGAGLTSPFSVSASSWDLSEIGIATAGEVLVLVCAFNNVQTTDGETTFVSDVTCADTGTWTKVAEFTNGQGAAAAGATVSVWYAVVTTTGSPSSFIVTGTSAVEKAAFIGHTFTKDASETVSVETYTTLAGDGIDPGAMSLSPALAEYLFFRGIAGETNSTTVLTPTTNYTGTEGAQTAGGGAAANMAARGEFRIVTSSSETSNPTWVSSDNANVFAALKLTAAGPAASLLMPNRSQSIHLRL